MSESGAGVDVGFGSADMLEVWGVAMALPQHVQVEGRQYAWDATVEDGRYMPLSSASTYGFIESDLFRIQGALDAVNVVRDGVPHGDRKYDVDWLARRTVIRQATWRNARKWMPMEYGTSWPEFASVLRDAGYTDLLTQLAGHSNRAVPLRRLRSRLGFGTVEV